MGVRRFIPSVFVAVVLAVGLFGCKHTIDLNDQDRDEILGQLHDSSTDLSHSIDGLQETLARERARWSQELQQTVGLAIANLRSVVEQLDRSIERMQVGVTNFQQDMTAAFAGGIARLQASIAELERSLAGDAAALVSQAATELDRQRDLLLQQTYQLVQSVIRPTMERLSREGDYFVGKVTIAANVLVVRVVTGGLAALALVGLVVVALKLGRASQRWPVMGVLIVVLLGAGTSATVLAAPLARIGAQQYRIPSGSKVCADMTEAQVRFQAAVPRGTPSPDDAPGAGALATALKDLSVECEVFAPTAALAQQAQDGFAIASAYFGQSVRCVSDDQCTALGPGLRCDAATGQCRADVCDQSAECPAGAQCVAHRCLAVDDPGAFCDTPAACRPEQACDRTARKCVVAADVQPLPCEVEGQLGPCRQGVRAVVERWLTCKQVVERQLEECNGVDDDCDGTVDQGLVRADACVAAGAVGQCADGRQVCAGVAGWQCQAGVPQDEVASGCNGHDDDCDGTVDEGVTLGGSCSAGVGGCADRATWQCIAGAQQCVPGNPVAEVCNGVDDDCDGKTDGFDPDLAQIVETCNGFDDNCNGSVDEGQFCHPVKVVARDVDDETFVWVGESSDPRNAACTFKLRYGGGGECDLVQALRDRGIGPGRQLFTIMTVNSGCFGTSSHADVVTDRETQGVHEQGRVTAHCGWVERDQFEVDFTTGEVFRGQNWGCVNDGNCRP